MPSKELRNRIERRAGGPVNSEAERALVGRREVLKDAQERAEWEKWESSRRQEEEDKAEAERIAFAEIDWQDFQVASTIEFTESDEAGLAELPPPMSLSEVENMTLAQKKMNAIFIDGNEGEEEQNGQEEEEMEMDDDDDEAAPAPQAEDKVEVATLDANLPVKIRKDYVRGKKDKKGQAYTTFDGQQVPVEEFSKHVRYELLDPRWKEEKKQADLNRSAANLLPGGKSPCFATPTLPLADHLLAVVCRYRRFVFDSSHGCSSSRYLRRLAGRQGVQEASRRVGEVEGSREGRLGRTRRVEGINHESLPSEREFRRTNRIYPSSETRSRVRIPLSPSAST